MSKTRDSLGIDSQSKVQLEKALRVLLQANHLAAEVKRELWDFAVEIKSLREEGINDSHFRWLACKGIVEHADEITLLGQAGRSFRPTGELTFTERTCFILSPLGVKFAREFAGIADEVPGIKVASTDLFSVDESVDTLPMWHADLRELTFAGALVKRFRHRSPNQETVLAAFQEERWTRNIHDPLPPKGNTEPKRRLNDTIKGLNHYHENHLIRFRGNGTGMGVIWEAVT